MFYVTIALGGLLERDLERRLVAPLVFSRVVEYPLALVLALPCRTRVQNEWRQRRKWDGPDCGDLLFRGRRVLVSEVIPVTNLAGMGDSAFGALGVMIAAGMGFLSCVTAQRKSFRFALVVAAVLAAGSLSPGVKRADYCTSSVTSLVSCASLTTPSTT